VLIVSAQVTVMKHLNLRLPSISGFELAERMRAIETDGKRTPIIGHSTVANPEEVEPLCLAAGMDALCAKLTCLYDMHDLFRQWLNCPLVMPVFLVDVHVPSTVAI
jgi:CheY-like chemotaxis protein